ncbi:MAG: hypothetical protein EP344_01990 [Bacteroidetes bacterium]|nr:MAG: hypothetical protein EP344_01990 [Bacteroidota bacterium]
MLPSRRKVLKALGFAAGVSATGLLPTVVFGKSAASAIPNKSRILGKKGVDAILLGAGVRGDRYSRYAVTAPQELRIVAVAEPIGTRNQAAAVQNELSALQRFDRWEEVLKLPRFADVVIISSSGSYFEAASAALRAGYDVWVDRPVSLDASEMDRINALARREGRQLLFAYGCPESIDFMDHAHCVVPF